MTSSDPGPTQAADARVGDASDGPDASTQVPMPEGADPVEWAEHTAALDARFARHLEAAAEAVREAEQNLTSVREALERARQAAANRQYQSDRLVFMRASVRDELEGLDRKTTPKKVRVAYRYLVARAVELAEGEVAGFHADQAAAAREREQSVEAWLAAEQEGRRRLESARSMQARVLEAELAARRGLAVMVSKLGAGEARESA